MQLSWPRRRMITCRVDGRVNPWKNSNLKPPLQNQPPLEPLRPPIASGNDKLSSCSGNASCPSGHRTRIAAQRLKMRSPMSRKSSPNLAGRFICRAVSTPLQACTRKPPRPLCEEYKRPHSAAFRIPTESKTYCGGAADVTAASGPLCCTPIALPETTSCTRRFCARPLELLLSATGFALP